MSAVPAPTFHPPSGHVFPHSTQLSRSVDIRSKTNNGQIRYTIDGRDPDEVFIVTAVPCSVKQIIRRLLFVKIKGERVFP
jgi:hypothetical protein